MSLSGILNINKPPGITSFGVVAVVRRRTGVRRVGHSGTLDPAASGVLLVCLGQAVRITEYLMELPKTYRAEITLGAETTTDDAEGKVVTAGEYSGLAPDDVASALRGFEGETQQTPPVFSAVKLQGRAAHHRARRGEAITLEARRAVIYRLEMLRFDPPTVEIEAECGKGTYIRSLARDLGRRLGCGAHLARLVRTRSGPFDIAHAAALADLEHEFETGAWQERLAPMDCGLMHLPSLTLHIEDEKDVRHGQAVQLDEDRLVPLGELTEGLQCRAYAEDGSLVAMLAFERESGYWRPRKVFASRERAEKGGEPT